MPAKIIHELHGFPRMKSLRLCAEFSQCYARSFQEYARSFQEYARSFQCYARSLQCYAGLAQL
jgi:hypothetical protein